MAGKLSPENRQLKQRKRQHLAERRACGCSKCPEKHPDCLDFHHLDSTAKRFSLSSVGLSARISWDDFKSESRKCIVLCSNCHRKHHAQEKRLKNQRVLPIFPIKKKKRCGRGARQVALAREAENRHFDPYGDDVTDILAERFGET